MRSTSFHTTARALRARVLSSQIHESCLEEGVYKIGGGGKIRRIEVRNELFRVALCLRGRESVTSVCKSGEMAASGLKVAMLALLVLSCWWGTANGDICTTAINNLIDCRGYVLGLSNSVSGSCCVAVKKLYMSTSGNTQLRRQLCNCFKQYASLLNAQHVSALPGACNVKLSYTISPQTNCNSIN